MRSAEYPLNAEGVWCEIFTKPVPGCPALFLDRDGTVIEEAEYPCRIEDVVMVPGAANVIAVANQCDVGVVLVTNQAGIGRGYYGWPEFRVVQQAIIARLITQGARLNAVYACAHHLEGRDTFSHPNHPSRKPNPGMVLQAAFDLALDLSRSWLVGDKASDIEAAKRAGLAGAMHVSTGHGVAERQNVARFAASSFQVRFGRSIADAMTLPIFSLEG